MAILVGIDEAGYGPVLGPLVVSSSVFELPQEYLREDLWKILSNSISINKRQSKGRLLITDSKKAYNRKSGLDHLERTTLACLNCLGEKPENLEALLNVLSPQTLARLGDYPWYCGIDEKQIDSASSDVCLSAGVFSRDMSEQKVELLNIQSSCLDVAYYNSMVEKVRNKAAVLFTAVCTHIQKAFDAHGDHNLQIIIDRQGGRSHYVPILSKMFPDFEIRILREDKDDCSYEMRKSGKSMRLHFVVKGDARFMPVALASIISKYLREVMLQKMNQYFIDLAPDIKPTAGYWQDGLRFAADVRKLLPDAVVDDAMFLRSR